MAEGQCTSADWDDARRFVWAGIDEAQAIIEQNLIHIVGNYFDTNLLSKARTQSNPNDWGTDPNAAHDALQSFRVETRDLIERSGL
jgi:hypothetical protein